MAHAQVVRVAPPRVDGIFAAVTAASKSLQVRVGDLGSVKRGCESLGVELRNVARFRDGAYVNEVADAVCF